MSGNVGKCRETAGNDKDNYKNKDNDDDEDDG